MNDELLDRVLEELFLLIDQLRAKISNMEQQETMLRIELERCRQGGGKHD